jgi:dTDP-4-dehydrorhamnose 3,5-epimerase
MLFVPPGFAHGFVTLEDDTIFTYKCTDTYNKEAEDALLWNDPELGINWGIDNPIISEKDQMAGKFAQFNSPFE